MSDGHGAAIVGEEVVALRTNRDELGVEVPDAAEVHQRMIT